MSPPHGIADANAVCAAALARGLVAAYAAAYGPGASARPGGPPASSGGQRESGARVPEGDGRQGASSAVVEPPAPQGAATQAAGAADARLTVVVSPGSRSTPLVLALAAHPEVRLYSVLDERAAAFVALGLAQASGRCVATLCTSGSAAAHALPAAIEAHHAGVPLVLLTADRPAEAQGVGAAQTTPQADLFVAHARWTACLPAPVAQGHPGAEGAAAAARAVAGAWQAAGVRAMVASGGPWPGPVHLNLPFREPLGTRAAQRARLAEVLPRPPPACFPAAAGTPSPRAVAALVAFLRGPGPGLVYCGAASPAAGDVASVAAAVHRLASRCGWPVVAEGLSGVRTFGPGAQAGQATDGAWAAVFPAAQVLLGAPNLPRPRRVLRLGAAPMGRAGQALLGAAEVDARCVVVPPGTWSDPRHEADLVLQADAAALLDAALAKLPPADETQRVYAACWARAAAVLIDSPRHATRAADPAARHVPDDACGANRSAEAEPRAQAWFEGSALHAALAALPDGACAVVGNSLAVRDLDGHCASLRRLPHLYGRRGASGIDGALAHLLGVGLARPRRPCVAFLGDCTFAYDIGALTACAKAGLRLVVVVFDNGGGEIFAQLPIASNEQVFEPYFRTPQKLDVRAHALAAGAGYARAADASQLAHAVRVAAHSPAGLQVVEACFAAPEARAVRRAQRQRREVALAAALRTAP